MMKKTVVVAIVSILAAGALVFGAGDEAPEAPAAPEAPVLEMKIYADNWSWSPNTIRAKKGTRVILGPFRWLDCRLSITGKEPSRHPMTSSPRQPPFPCPRK